MKQYTYHMKGRPELSVTFESADACDAMLDAWYIFGMTVAKEHGIDTYADDFELVCSSFEGREI